MGEDVSIGFDWRATLMANSSRDPYWQASVRRETIDHPESTAEIEDTCARCHMPMERYAARSTGARRRSSRTCRSRRAATAAASPKTACRARSAIRSAPRSSARPESFTGGFEIDPPDAQGNHHEYGPYAIDAGHTLVMKTSTEGFVPTRREHIRKSEMCATCHTLITETLGPGGKPVGRLPEQVPFQEWLHSDYKDAQSCQSCHMPVVEEPVPITRVFGEPRQMARHVFVAANFFVQRMLNRYRDALDVAALPQELDAAAARTEDFLATQGGAADARRRPRQRRTARNRRSSIENLGGHKLPTAYPSRRAWIHFVVRDSGGTRRLRIGQAESRRARSRATTTTPTRRRSSRTTT